MFAIGTDGYVIAGLLPEIATATGVNISVAGQLITVFAIVYAVMSPVLASALGSLDRRTLLLLSLVVFALGNAIVASSELYSVLVIGRVVAAIGASMFTPAALTITGGLVEPARRGRSIALVTSGLTVATVAGVPLGIGLSAVTGYHGVFWIIAGLSLAVLLAVAIWFAPVAAPAAVSVSARLRALGSPGVRPTLLVSLLVFTGAFTVYNYIAEYFATRVGITASALPWILLAFGIGGAVGNLVGGTMTDRIGARKTVVVSAGALSVSFVLLWAAGSIAPVALVATMMWGVSGWLLAPAQQHRLLALGGPSAPLLISLNASAMYLGMGLSGALGGLMVATVGVEQLPLAGIAAAVASLIIATLGYRRSASGSA
ncbi:MFS transporter [Rathayibacter iranicus]|nr:MFS transporter [Rathayibacter iranicus]PWJ64729.1 putative MFS family arabinose efflux permease [Rathayibacter iranicus NCPPB 2253 = VKM Ac-1602]